MENQKHEAAHFECVHTKCSADLVHMTKVLRNSWQLAEEALWKQLLLFIDGPKQHVTLML